MIIARILAPDEVGTYFLITSLVSVVVVFSLFGMNVAIVRIISSSMAIGKEAVVRSAANRARLACLVTSFLCAALLYFVGLEFFATRLFKSDAIFDLRLLIAIWIVLWCLETLNAEIFRGFKQFHLAVLFMRFAPNSIILAISAVVFFTRIDINLQDYLKIVLFGWLCAVIVSSALLQKYFLANKPSGHYPYRSLVSTSMPLWLTNWITFSLPLLDLWILAMYQPAENLALYGAAARLALIVSMPLFVIQAVVPALIAEAYAEKKMDDLSKGLKAAAALSFYPGLMLCLVYFAFGDWILTLVFGEFYADAFLVLQILTLGVLIRIFAASSQSLLTMTGHGRTSMTISLCSGFLMVIACMYAGERYGMIGVATASTMVFGFHNFMNLLYARIRVGIWVVPVVSVSQIRNLVSRV